MKTRWTEVLSRGALILTLALSGCGVGSYAEAPRVAGTRPAPPPTWDAVFAHPAPLRVTAFVTGWVEAGPEILIDARDPRVPAALHEKIWVPTIAYLVEHPTRGRLLLDTGVRAGDCAFGLHPVFWVPCRNSPGSDAVSQLRALGLHPSDLDAVVVSHFHGDHASGLEALLRGGAPRIVTSRAELAAVQRTFRIMDGYIGSMLQDDAVVQFVDDALVPMPYVDRADDYFGDGSLWLVPTPGHTRGHLSAVVNAEGGPLLLTFDASHLEAGFTLGVPPGADTDEALARASLERLRVLAAAYPALQVLEGHEPSQWLGRGDRVVLRSPR